MYVPELESMRGWLAANFVGKRVRALHLASPRTLVLSNPVRTASEECIVWDPAMPLAVVERVGRHLMLGIGDDTLALIVRGHGALYAGALSRAVPLKWRVAVELDGSALWLCDPGNASRALLLAKLDPRGAEAALRDFDPQGVEPLATAFTFGSFKKVLRGRRRSIFQLLVDGQLIAGIGDGYATEILHASRVRPTRPASTLCDDELRAVYFSVLEILQKAIRFGGISDDQQPFIEGQPGGYRQMLSIYGRAGGRCPGCRGRVRLVTIDRASSFFCPRCQR